MKIWQFLFASGALATTPTAAQTTCFTSVAIAGAGNNCEGLYGDEGTCATTCSNGGTISHKCQCHDGQGGLLQNCKWDNTPAGSCTVDYHRIDFDVAYLAVGTTTIKATHEPILETYFKSIVDPSEAFSVVITGFTETPNSGNTDVTCKVTIKFDDTVTPSGWAAVDMNGATGAAYNFATVSTGLDSSLTVSKIIGTSSVSYEKVLASNPDAATDLLREVDAKEHVLKTITTKKAEKQTQENLRGSKNIEKSNLQKDINQLQKSDKTTKTNTRNSLESTKTTKQGELNAATGLVTAKQGEIDAVKL